RPAGTRKWTFTTGGTVNGSPALAPDGTIYFGAGSSSGTSANRLYAIKDIGGAGAEKWDFPTAGSVLSSPLVAPNGQIYFGSSGGKLYVLTDGRFSAAEGGEVTTGGA